MDTIERNVGSFIVKSDTGKTATLIIWQEFTDITPFNQDEIVESPGKKRYITSSGKPVKKIDENTY
jgi:hypothetical protein